ncbi:MAG: alkaline phosphatase family protein [Polyangiaceae bacterium]|nr:alkaline phosphatase family protein [Polyangiaceae bacterium]
MKRRTVVQATLGVAGSAVLGCSDDTDPTGGGGSAQGGDAPNGGAPGTGGSGGSPNGQGGEGAMGGGNTGGSGQGGEGGSPGDLCTEDGGLSPEELLAPIQTIVVLMMENRSFDHYLGALKLVEGRMDIDGLDGTESNPAPDGSSVGVFNLTDFTVADPPHEWDAAHEQYNDGANDGFVIAHEGDNQNDVMGYHVREQLPITYALADASAICNQWYASVMGPTWPNRFYMHGASSEGKTNNTPIFGGFDNIFAQLDDAGITNQNYYHDLAWCNGAYFKFGGTSGIESFFEAAAAGTLPQFSLIDPQFFGSGANDDHPDHDVQLGQALIASVYQALAQSPQWGNCLFIITYDEHGGFYDHVPPPITTDDNADFIQLGFRVPSLVIGPYVRKGCAVDTVFEHVSVIKTLCTKFGLPHLNQRVTAAKDLSSCIQPEYLKSPQAPVRLPPLEISMSAVLARPARNYHPELWAIAESGLIPKHLDRRSDSIGITKRVLAWGERLGALRIKA